ncbi:MAG: hypothetical protein COU47_02130 [Candidatus Niyogibacteria bacterium CG10_big_fil_rev_8_21_14_0_10_46_36]|uniref:DUF502 domain-containing protein n=1 Tax=Candidatus Niyogibacteria bacterium CG10_big_fil_rev_8_21_14_0_10_46_36 TaxID=1974726 RepID=A0A2H0TFE4_9BACT|nr:MAG: hypothetical protein COU47_02130 [Candidatus Niyogibacteria bacterium CG10_big_fil_rev_8_21_14_0_10_46_36]
MKKYTISFKIGQSLKLGFIGIGFVGIMLYAGYLISWSVGKLIFKMLKVFVSIHPALQSPFGYALGISLIIVFAYVAGVILEIRTGKEGEEPLNQKLSNKIPGCNLLFEFFKTLIKSIHNIKNCRFVLVKTKKEVGWEDAEFIMLGILYDEGQAIMLPERKKIVRPATTVSIPPNPVTGFLGWPHRDCILLLKTPRDAIIKTIVSFGTMCPKDGFEVEEDQSQLDKYFTDNNTDEKSTSHAHTCDS